MNASLIKYKATHWFSKATIEIVHVQRETPTSVILNDGRRALKRLATTGYFDTHAQAKDWLLEESEKALDGCRRSLQIAQSVYGNVVGMKP